ncbi:MAG TPA: YMGG-like glycine zipper-containing protein [Chitinophagaceae bacterium]|nr:YMGG-like glycine zipper-containing protein [Chitinophagaceae bacterium]
MKKLLFGISVFTLTATMVACNSGPKADLGNQSNAVVIADTNGLAEFQSWKVNQLKNTYAVNSTKKTTASRSSGTARKTGSYSTQTSYPAKPAKKGWSKAAKGAVIGAGSGAVIGAVINKRNRAVGAAIGGVIGGGVGYGIGRTMDKKDGRY